MCSRPIDHCATALNSQQTWFNQKKDCIRVNTFTYIYIVGKYMRKNTFPTTPQIYIRPPPPPVIPACSIFFLKRSTLLDQSSNTEKPGYFLTGNIHSLPDWLVGQSFWPRRLKRKTSEKSGRRKAVGDSGSHSGGAEFQTAGPILAT